MMHMSTRMSLKHVPPRAAMDWIASRVPQADPDAIETALKMKVVSDNTTGASQAHFARHGLSHGRFGVLMNLFRAQEKGIIPAQLADEREVSRATMTGLIDGLERDGLAQRRRHPQDRRKVQVFITAAGQKFMMKMLPDHFRRLSALLERLTKKERAEFRRLLDKINAGVPAVRNP